MKRINLPKDITIDDRNIIRCTATSYKKKYISHKALARVLADRDVEGTDTDGVIGLPTWWTPSNPAEVEVMSKSEAFRKKVQTRAKKYVALLETTFPQLL